MSVIDPRSYTIAIQKIEIEGDSYFEATVRELPDLRDYGETEREAYDLAIDSISTAMEMYREEGRRFPAPTYKWMYSDGTESSRYPLGQGISDSN